MLRGPRGYGAQDSGQARKSDGPSCDGSVGSLQALPGLTHEGAVFPSAFQRFAPFLAEFLGTFLLTTTFIYNYGHNHDPMWASTSNGLMLVALTYAFFHVSGANLNPSISLALLMSGRQSAGTVARLCAAQICGAAAAAALLAWQLSHTIIDAVDIGPTERHSWRAVILIEVIFTGVLCFVYLNCAASSRNNPWRSPNGFVGLAVGFTVVAGGYASREVSHVVMNSAIAVGLGVVESHDGFSGSSIAYFLADLAGAFLASGAYRLVRPGEADAREAPSVPSPGASTRGALVRRAQAERKLRQREADTAKVAAEFFGTFVVIFTKALNRLGTQATPLGPEAWSVAAALTSMVYALRNVSGAHFNPAVTLAAVLSGRSGISCRTAVFYVIAQVFAGVAASSMFEAMNHRKPIPLTFSVRAPTSVEFYAECTFTFLVAYVVLSMSVPSPGVGSNFGAASTKSEDAEAIGSAAPGPGAGRATAGAGGGAADDIAGGAGSFAAPRSDIAGFAYGACHVASGFAVGHISGAMLNPAVVLSFNGLDFFRGTFRGDVMLYIVWQVIGALLATGVFFVTHARLYSDPEDEPDDRLEAAA